MELWKLLLSLCFLTAASANELSQKLTSRNSTRNDILKIFPQHRQTIKTLFEKLSKTERGAQVAILNDYADDLLINLQQFIYQQSLDPYPMPDIIEEFEWKIWPITYRGEMALTSGWLQGLGTMTRRDDVLLWYEYPNVKIEMKLGYEVLMFDYQYVAKFMGFGPDGGMDGKVKNCKWTLNLNLNMITLKAELERYHLDDLGSISLKFNGSLFDWLVNIFVSVTLPFVKPVIKFIVEAFIQTGLDVILISYNNFITSVLEPQLIL